MEKDLAGFNQNPKIRLFKKEPLKRGDIRKTLPAPINPMLLLNKSTFIPFPRLKNVIDAIPGIRHDCIKALETRVQSERSTQKPKRKISLEGNVETTTLSRKFHGELSVKISSDLHYASKRNLSRSLSELQLRPKRSSSRARSIGKYQRLILVPEEKSNIEPKLSLPCKFGVIFLLTIPANKASKSLSFDITQPYFTLSHSDINPIQPIADSPSENLTRESDMLLTRQTRRESGSKGREQGFNSTDQASNSLHQSKNDPHGEVSYANNLTGNDKLGSPNIDWPSNANPNFESNGRDSNETTLDSEPQSPQLARSKDLNFKSQLKDPTNRHSHTQFGRFDCQTPPIDKAEGPLKFLEKFKQFARKSEPHFTESFTDHLSVANSNSNFQLEQTVASLNGLLDVRHSLPDNFQLRPVPVVSMHSEAWERQCISREEQLNGSSDAWNKCDPVSKPRANFSSLDEPIRNEGKSSRNQQFSDPISIDKRFQVSFQDAHLTESKHFSGPKTNSIGLPPDLTNLVPTAKQLPNSFNSFKDVEQCWINSENYQEKLNCNRDLPNRSEPDPLSIPGVQAQRHINGLDDMSESNCGSHIDDDSSMRFTISDTDQIFTGSFSFKYS